MKGQSPFKRSLKRFTRNIPAIAGLVVILIAVVLAILGYLITPDKTNNANDQVLQITNKAPGFETKMLLKRKNKTIDQSGFFHTMLFGKQNPYEQIPVKEIRFEKDKVIAQELTGSDAYNPEKSYEIADILFAVDSKKKIEQTGNQINYFTIDGSPKSISLKEAQKQIEAENIVDKKFYLGTDKFGRDMLSRLIIGVRISLSVGIIAVVISLFIGIIMGCVAGYYRGKVDDLIMWFINVIWSIPTLLLVFAITLALGKGFWQIFIAVGLTMWVEVARVVRGQVMSLREIQFIEAAQSMGFSDIRTIFLHVLPNILGPIIVIAAANFASAILVEAGLSFLGIGVQAPMPSWGGMLNENYGYIIGKNPFLALIPGFAIMLMVLAFNLVGNGFRDALDVKTNLGEK